MTHVSLKGLEDMLLQTKNFHPRDGLLIFNEDEHKYSIGLIQFLSVTTFISKILFKYFDEDEISKIINQKEKLEGDKYYGLTDIEIKNLWKEVRDLGTELHKVIENYYNNIPNNNLNKFEKEFRLFKQFENEVVLKEGLIPYRTEWKIFDRELRLAGTIDMVYKTSRNTFIIYDWKRVEKLSKFNSYSSGIVPGITENTPDCNYTHYAIQLMLYKYMLEKNYNCVVERMFLLILHPSQVSYIKEEILNYPPLINNIVDYRIKTK